MRRELEYHAGSHLNISILEAVDFPLDTTGHMSLSRRNHSGVLTAKTTSPAPKENYYRMEKRQWTHHLLEMLALVALMKAEMVLPFSPTEAYTTQPAEG